MQNIKTYYKIIHYTDASYYEGTGYNSEGEFIYHGEGKLYYPNGRIAYEGDFSNGLFHGRGKEYYEYGGGLLYEGDFLNGKYHGSGHLYAFNELIFEGEFKNGECCGKGKKFYKGILDYEGTFLHDLKHGVGRKYYKNGNLAYEGEFKNGYPDGEGREYNQNGTWIEGTFVKGELTGWGKEYSPDGTLLYEGFFLEYYRYDGELANNMPNGNGKLYFKDTLLYKGDFVNGKRTGKGRYYFANGKILYEGEFLDNKRHGYGTEYAEDGSVIHQGFFIRDLYYEGEFLDEKPHGAGILRKHDGTISYEGLFANGLEHGQGREFTSRGKGRLFVYYEGLFEDGHRSVGTFYNEDGTIMYEAECDHSGFPYEGKSFYKDGALRYQGGFRMFLACGKGEEYYENGQVAYVGEFSHGRYNGFGTQYDKNGVRIYSGTFVKGHWEGDGTLYDDKNIPCYKGKFHKDIAWGQGISYREDGTPEFKGKFVDGKPVGPNMLYKNTETGFVRTPEKEIMADLYAPAQSELLKQCHQEFEHIIGLNEVKLKVDSLIRIAEMRRVREDRGLPNFPMSYHLVFTGNPGTGKTMVARLLAKIYFQIGITSKDCLIEVDRTQLVGEHVGESEAKTNKVICSARGGVLFIDEAYSLVREDGVGWKDPFGQEVIDCILKRMEDYRDDLIVIVAGYREPMERFIKSNPGLESRFNSYIHFPDYSTSELFNIFESFCTQYGHRIEPNARETLMDLFEKARHVENFSNARYVRNFFEKMEEALAMRLSSYPFSELSDKALQEFTIQDVRYVSAHNSEMAHD